MPCLSATAKFLSAAPLFMAARSRCHRHKHLPHHRALQLGVAGMPQVALSLYVYLGQHLLLQLEAFVSLLLSRLADQRSGAQTSELQEAALEVSLCCTWPPGLPHMQELRLPSDVAIQEGVAAWRVWELSYGTLQHSWASLAKNA